MDLASRKNSFSNALKRLTEAYFKAIKSGKDFEYFRDSAIQRFEITVEAFWKYVKVFLLEQEGVVCNSPKGCIRELFTIGYIDEGVLEVLFNMVDDRNLTSHTYNEEIADGIFKKIGTYIEVIGALDFV